MKNLYKNKKKQEKVSKVDFRKYLKENVEKFEQFGYIPGKILKLRGECEMSLMEAVNCSNGRTVAIKLYYLEQGPNQESDILKLLNGQCHVLELLDCFELQDYFTQGLVFPLYRGDISDWNPKDEKQLATFVLQLLEAIRYCHSNGIVHCDIKPTNILYNCDKDENFNFVLSDFGLALTGIKLNQIGSNVDGTYGYMAPEAVKNEEGPLCALDIWSFGIVILEMVTGCSIFQGVDRNDVLDELKIFNVCKELQQTRICVSDCFKDLIIKMLALNPTERLSAEEVWNHPYCLSMRK